MKTRIQPAATRGRLSCCLASAAAIALGGVAVQPVVAAELVVNGNFEEPFVDPASGSAWMTYFGQNSDVDPGEYCELFLGDWSYDHCGVALIPGWSVLWSDTLEPGRIELQRDRPGEVIAIAAKEGVQKAELDSHHRLDSEDANVLIGQELATCPETAYTLKYSWTPRVPEETSLLVLINDELLVSHPVSPDAIDVGLTWFDETFHFIADSGSFANVLAFKATSSGDTEGVFLDAVSVVGADGSNEANCTRVSVCEHVDPCCKASKPPTCDHDDDDYDHRTFGGGDECKDEFVSKTFGGSECDCDEGIASRTFFGGGDDCDCNDKPGDQCVIESRPAVLTLLYDADRNGTDLYEQTGVMVDPQGVGLPNEVKVVVFANDENGGVLYDRAVHAGETFDISGPGELIPARLHIEMYSMDANELLQTVAFDTSCEQGLFIGDQFGGIAVWGASL